MKNNTSKSAVKMPRDLSCGAQEEWKRLAPLAQQLGTLTPTDVPAFCLLCETMATARQCWEEVRTQGYTLPLASGSRKPNPVCKTMETARMQASRLLQRFGLTPDARKSSVALGGDDDDHWAGML